MEDLQQTESVQELTEAVGQIFFKKNSVDYEQIHANLIKNKLVPLCDNYISNYGDINIRSKISYLDELALASDNVIPNNVSLSNAYPNPFNPRTKIVYTLNNSGYISLNIYDLKGSKIKSLINKYQTPGTMSITWDGSNDNGQLVAAGMYIYMIKTEEVSISKKMILLK